MPTTVELPTLQELSVDEVSGGRRLKKKAETKASLSASPLVSLAAQDALLQVSVTLLTSVTFILHKAWRASQRLRQGCVKRLDV